MTHAQLIIRTVCRRLRLSESQLLSPLRHAKFVKARMIAILLLTRRSYTDQHIAWYLNRAKCTVTILRNKAMARLDADSDFARTYDKIKNAVDNGTDV